MLRNLNEIYLVCSTGGGRFDFPLRRLKTEFKWYDDGFKRFLVLWYGI